MFESTLSKLSAEIRWTSGMSLLMRRNDVPHFWRAPKNAETGLQVSIKAPRISNSGQGGDTHVLVAGEDIEGETRHRDP